MRVLSQIEQGKEFQNVVNFRKVILDGSHPESLYRVRSSAKHYSTAACTPSMT